MDYRVFVADELRFSRGEVESGPRADVFFRSICHYQANLTFEDEVGFNEIRLCVNDGFHPVGCWL